MPTLAFSEPATTLDDKTDKKEDTDDNKRIEDRLNQYCECCLCYSMKPEMIMKSASAARIWQGVFGGPHIWVSRDICGNLRNHSDADPPTRGGYPIDDRGWSFYCVC